MVCGVLNVVRMNNQRSKYMKQSLNQRSKCMKQVLFIVLLAGCLVGFAGNEAASTISKDDKAAIEFFFKEFVNSFNSKDVERVRKMSGKTWEKWLGNMKNDVKLKSIVVRNVSRDRMISVTTQASAIDMNGRTRLDEVVFTLRKYDGDYAIEDMIVPEVDKRNKELRAAAGVVEKLILAINAQDMEAVKAILSFGDVPGFETELSPRGLSWITNAVQNQIKVPRRGSGVSRGNRRSPLQGRVCVPSSTGGTNILEQFYFKDGKIDRAVPRRETKEEFLKRVAAENAAARKQWEAREAAEQKKIEEQFREWIRKQKKRDGEGAK